MKVAVLGTGSWGTALAQLLVENGHQVGFWGRDQEPVEEINQNHTNQAYLKNISLNPALKASQDMRTVLEGAQMIVWVLPTQAIRPVCQQVQDHLRSLNSSMKPLLVHATKGLEPGTHYRISQVMAEVIDPSLYQDIVVLSGPSHAEEVARHDLTTVTAASHSLEAAEVVQEAFMSPYFRVYTNQDVIGVELGAALKNIIALCAGLIAGVGYGDNAKAALLTRGLAEISRLGIKMGADPLTFAGLSGVGDLVVTCTSPHSRNWQAGQWLAKGYSLEETVERVQMVVEGVSTCAVAYELAQELGVEMPITQALYGILYQGKDVKTSLQALMMRQGKQEASLSHHLQSKGEE
ncbi:NAD(P)H-dependent glycerol-3-phosphate dehydrogenase [Vaginisenegalia massiliensis]|uniref:NAD(P)H-dependent glycerol-3-phosphate dehydrogenase n=1 Tax=Vaginisenegalia massiliensis TaxID=2058294 RepID=UPI000F544A3F|nr:NAD(P)H-dependent glycerol-3-phosphate dehydrogenase [Vaginisenegalia massiliensis]